MQTSPRHQHADRAAADGPASSAEGWRVRMLLGAVLFALVALAALPMIGERQARPLYYEMRQVAEPGRSLVTQLHVALAIEGSALSGYLVSADPVQAQRFRSARAAEQVAHDSLRSLAQRLGPGVVRRYAELDTLQRLWHAAAERRLENPRAAGSGADRLATEQYEALLLATARLDEAINEAARARRAAIVRAERSRRISTFLLVVIAALAAGSVMWLGTRLHRFAVDADDTRVALERAAEARARLMRGISHDLNNPLTTIEGYLELLEGGDFGALADEQRVALTQIRGATGAMTSLVRDLVQLSQAEAGRLRVTPAPVDLRGTVEQAMAEHRANADAAGHQLVADLPAATPVVTDAGRVRQVLGNLLSNAIKYTPPGGSIVVRLRDRAREGHPEATWIAVDVLDSGPGVPPEQAEAIFDEFARLDAHHAKPGVGLGLAISRRIARLLGGDITVAGSELGGAAFTLWLPAPSPAIAA